MSSTTTTPLECVALATLLRMSELSQVDLSTDLRISESLVSKYVTTQVPPPDRLGRILEMTGFEREDYERLLSALTRAAARRRRTLAPATPVDPTPDEWSDIHARASILGREAEQRSVERQAEMLRVRKAAAARAEAETLCALLEADPKPWLAVEKVRKLHTWAVAERLAQRSIEAAPDCVDRARELAALACRVAELAPCEPLFRSCLLGYTLGFRENAERAAGNLREAEALFQKAVEHWTAGAGVSGPLQEWRLQGLAGSLHRDQQRLNESLAQLDASLANAPAEARGRLLATKALTVDRMGNTERAVELLIEAEQTLDRQKEPLLLFIVLFNRAAFLNRLGRPAEATLLVQEIEALPESLRRGLQRIRLLWLRGSVDAGLGRWDEAEDELQTARRELADRKADLECAFASLELMVLLCRRERSQEIRTLALDLAALSRSERLSRAAQAALQLVCAADEGPGVTVEVAELALDLLRRAPKADGTDTPEPPDEPSVLLADRRSDSSVATAVGVDSAPAIQSRGACRGLQDAGGRGPETVEPDDQLVHEAGGLEGVGPAGRQGG